MMPFSELTVVKTAVSLLMNVTVCYWQALYSRLFSWIVKKINILLKSSNGYSRYVKTSCFLFYPEGDISFTIIPSNQDSALFG